MDESRRLAMRRAHTKHSSWCTCGNIVCGNGAITAHHAMHKRKGDGHKGVVRDEWWKRVGAGTITPIKQGKWVVDRKRAEEERAKASKGSQEKRT